MKRITQEALLAAGYNPFKQRNIKEFTEQFYQKLFYDELGKRYFITIAVYDNRKYKERIPDIEDFSYSPASQFTTNSGSTFNVEMLSPKSVEEMEAFFEKMWCSLECTYYEKYYYEEPQ